MIRNYDMWHNYPNSYYAKAKVKRNKSIFYLFEFFPNLSWLENIYKHGQLFIEDLRIIKGFSR